MEPGTDGLVQRGETWRTTWGLAGGTWARAMWSPTRSSSTRATWSPTGSSATVVEVSRKIREGCAHRGAVLMEGSVLVDELLEELCL